MTIENHVNSFFLLLFHPRILDSDPLVQHFAEASTSFSQFGSGYYEGAKVDEDACCSPYTHPPVVGGYDANVRLKSSSSP